MERTGYGNRDSEIKKAYLLRARREGEVKHFVAEVDRALARNTQELCVEKHRARGCDACVNIETSYKAIYVR